MTPNVKLTEVPAAPACSVAAFLGPLLTNDSVDLQIAHKDSDSTGFAGVLTTLLGVFFFC